MYLKPQIHGTQDTLTIHVGYIGIHRDTYKDTYLEPYLRPSSTSGAAECWSWPTSSRTRCTRWWHQNIPPTPEIRIPHVSRMYLARIQNVSGLYLDCHWGYMYPARIPYVSCMYPACRLRIRYMYLNFVSRCILMYHDEESKIHVSWCILTHTTHNALRILCLT